MKQGKKSIGHPVDVASGAQQSEYEDCSIPGKIDLVWKRSYDSSRTISSKSPIGKKWISPYFATLTAKNFAFELFSDQGDIEIFNDPEGTVRRGGTIRNHGTFQELCKRGEYYIVTQWDVDTGEVGRLLFKAAPKDETMPLARIEDVAGNSLTLLYNLSSRLTGIRQDREDRELHIDYIDKDKICEVSLILPNNKYHRLVSYEYNSAGQLTAVHNTAGNTDHYEYDEKSNITREILKGGADYYFEYDEKERCVKTAGLDRYDEKSFKYFEDLAWTEVTDSLGNITRFQYTPEGQVVTEVDQLGCEEKTEYDEHGRIAAKIDPNGAITKYEYDEKGNRSKTTDPLGNITTLTFNESHLPYTLTDPNGNLWKREYDFKNRLVKTRDPLGAEWKFNYDNQGNLIQVIDPKGARLTQSFNSYCILKESIDWEGNTTRYHFDFFGRIIKRTGPESDITNFQYDAAGNPTRIESPDKSIIEANYDTEDNLTSFKDGQGYTTKYRYGSCNRLLQRIDPMGNSVSYKWGSESDILEKVINEKGEVYNFVYDAGNRVIEEKGFDGRIQSFKYDPAGNCTSVTNGLGEDISYKRDPVGNIINEKLPDDKTADFEYDCFGNLISAVNSDCKVIFERDALGRVIKEYQDEHTILSKYDIAGNLIHTKTNLDHQVSYKHDNNGQLTELTTNGKETFRFERNSYGEEIKRTLPGDLKLEQTYDNTGQLKEQKIAYKGTPLPGRLTVNGKSVLPSGYNLVHRKYDYDKRGDLTKIEDIFRGNTWYSYDPAQRLNQALRDKGLTEHFQYDSTGNIAKINEKLDEKPKFDADMEYGEGNRLIRKDDTKFFYDDNGRLIKKTEKCKSKKPDEWNYSWDGKDQMSSIVSPDGEKWEYGYDALGRRIYKKDSSGLFERFVWDGNIVIHNLKENKLKSTWIYQQDSFEPIFTIQNNSIYSVIADHLGTPHEILDSKGDIVWAASYKTWGEIDRLWQGEGEKVDCPIRFQGQWFDKESGLHYNRFRYYDPQCGRFICEDPIGLAGGENLYFYAPNSISWVDPFGLNNCPNKKPPNLSPEGAGRRGAFREAKRNVGVPVSKRPSRITPNKDKRGKLQPGRNYEFDVSAEGGGTKTIIIREDSGGDYYGPDDPQNRGPHFNDPDGGHYDY